MRPTSMIAGASRWGWIVGLAAGAIVALLPASTQSAIANGDTRTLTLVHAHTHETITATFLVDGQYDQAVLDKLNWFLRDWRRDEPTHMDPRLFDVVWEVYRESGSQQPIMVMSAYRSPETNAMLRRRSRQVAEHSQHILGRAMDQHYMDVPMSKIRELGMRLQRGGVGFYPTAGTPFVHLDVGGVRHWPRMSYDQLARLFPDGKTVHIPSNGVPLPGYETARAELESRGDGSYPTASQLKSKGFFAWLFGGGGSDEEDDDAAAGVKRKAAAGRPAYASNGPVTGSSADAFVGSYGKNASDRVMGGGGIFQQADTTRYGFTPAPAAPVIMPRPAVPPVPLAAAPVPEPLPSQPAPQQAVAMAVSPRPSDGTPALGLQSSIRDLPVPQLLPLPPRRPAELVAVEPAAPLPPPRPQGLMAAARGSAVPHDATSGAGPSGQRRSDAIALLLATSRTAQLPDVITQGSGKPSARALGYAAVAGLTAPGRGSDAAPMPVSRPSLLSTHLDRSNFRTLTGPEGMDRSLGRSALGAAVPPLRGATRADLGALPPDGGARGSFQPGGGPGLTTKSFSGEVLRPPARIGGG